MRRLASLLAMALLAPAIDRARAAEGVQVEQFEPRPAGSGWLTTATSETLPDGAFTLALWGSYADRPLRLVTVAEGDPRAEKIVVADALRTELIGAWGALDGLQVWAALPFAVGLGEGDVTLSGRTPEDLAAPGLGDARIGVLLEPGALFGDTSLHDRWGVGLAVETVLWLPTGDTDRLEGTGTPRVATALIADMRHRRWGLAVNFDLQVGNEGRLFNVVDGLRQRWRVAASAPTPWTRLDLQGSVFGALIDGEQPDPQDVRRTIDAGPYDPVEGLLALRARLPAGFDALVGGGAGLSTGIGAPQWRAVLRLGWSHPADVLSLPGDDFDSDGDGIAEALDVCPYEPERLDGVRDEDGCPEAAPAFIRARLALAGAADLPPLPAPDAAEGPLPDADGDRVPDEIDRCPAEAEDRDGFEDGDGCPDPDNDRDGIADAVDRCPTVAETAGEETFGEGGDGCPAVGPDGDGDGIGDRFDACPGEAETVNGLRDWDGCPEGFAGRVGPAPDAAPLGPLPLLPPLARAGDRDGDGLADADDLCPAEPEDRDGFQDDDGCPDPDDDGDGIPDADDECPQAAETPNGYADDDGCPDVGPDADGDGVGDRVDVCPYEPEVPDGVRDGDGCPEWVPPEGPPLLASPLLALAPLTPVGDPDGDGLAGLDDACPTTAEDLDGFEDGDGCPEADDDADGVPDVRDACRRVAETANFFNDGDGCPDLAPVQVAGIIGAVESIQFKVGRSDLRPGALPVLRRVARVMRQYPRLRLQIDGHTDSTGERERNFELSNDRAASVRAWLIAQGIESSRLSSFGYGPDRPVASNRDLHGRYENRRVELSYTEPGSGPAQ